MTERVDQNIWIKTGKEKEIKASPLPKHSTKLQFFIVEKNVLGLELGGRNCSVILVIWKYAYMYP